MSSPNANSIENTGGRWTLALTERMLHIRDDVLEAAHKREPHMKPSVTTAMWKEVARRLHESDPMFSRDWKSCRDRFNNLKTAYRNVMDRRVPRPSQGDSGDGGPHEPPLPEKPIEQSDPPAGEPPPTPTGVKKEVVGRALSQDVFALMDSRFGSSPATRPPIVIQLGTDTGVLTPPPPFAADFPSSGPASGPPRDAVAVTPGTEGVRRRRRVNVSGKSADTTRKVEELSSSVQSMMQIMQQDMRTAAESNQLLKDLLLEDMKASAERDRLRAEEEKQERHLLLQLLLQRNAPAGSAPIGPPPL